MKRAFKRILAGVKYARGNVSGSGPVFISISISVSVVNVCILPECQNAKMPECPNAKLVMPECLSNIVNMTHSCDMSASWYVFVFLYVYVYVDAYTHCIGNRLVAPWTCVYIWNYHHLLLMMGLIIASPVNGKISQLIMHACCSVRLILLHHRHLIDGKCAAAKRVETKVNSIIKAGYKL